MAQLLKLLTDPDRVCPCFHGNAHSRQVGKPLVDAGWVCSEPAPVDHFTTFVESAVMAPDIPKVDADRDPDLRTVPWYFCDEVLRMLLHPLSLSLLQSDRLIPVFGKLPFGASRRVELTEIPVLRALRNSRRLPSYVITSGWPTTLPE